MSVALSILSFTTMAALAAQGVDPAVVVSTVVANSDPGAWASISAVMDKIMAILSNPITGQIVTILLGLLGGGKWLKNRAIQRWAFLAHSTVEEMARTNPGNEKLDKVAAFSEVFAGYMKRAGWVVVTNSDIQQAQALAKSVNLAYTNAVEFKNGGTPPAK